MIGTELDLSYQPLYYYCFIITILYFSKKRDIYLWLIEKGNKGESIGGVGSVGSVGKNQKSTEMKSPKK